MATPNYDVNYNDDRFTKVTSEEQVALEESDKLYDGMIAGSDKYFDDQIEGVKDWADEQTRLQNEQTDFAIEQIEQQKEQAKKDYTKEQSGAYVDWQKESNQYGANAERMAAQGLAGAGYSESAQVSMYNTYQNRVMTAREAYSRAVLNYDNLITEAKLQNSSVLAEIAFEALQKELELSLAGFQYKNTLILAKADKRTEIKNTYYQRYQDVLKQINTENALKENIRQHNETLAEQRRQHQAEMAFKETQFAWQKAQAAKSSSSGGSIKNTSSGSSKKSSGSSKSSKSSSSSSSTKLSSAQRATVGKAREVGLSNVEVDMNSVLALGFGPISESRLDELVQSGIVQEYVSGNKIKFKLSAAGLKQKQLYSRLG